MAQDLYKFAAQNQLRFPSVRGELTVEQLFELPLKSKSEFDLDSVARQINKDLKETAEESFVEDAATNPLRHAAETAFAIVKDVIATKQEENRAEVARQNRVVERKKILDTIAAKKDQLLTAATMEDLEKKLAELD